MQGLVVVFVVLALFLDLKIAFWVAMGIPFSMLGTGAIMYGTDQTLNMLSMFAFLMAIGIVVDDAIVVSDNIDRHRRMGKSLMAAAIDGADTLEKVASFKPDVILLDVMMPKLSGFEVCQRLKSDPATSRIMILMVTALGELGDIERAVEAGTDDFLSKPVNRVELVKRVENMLKLGHIADELERLRSYIRTMDDDQPPR